MPVLVERRYASQAGQSMFLASFQIFAEKATDIDKMLMELDCHVQWRTLGQRTCKVDYNANCPLGAILAILGSLTDHFGLVHEQVG